MSGPLLLFWTLTGYLVPIGADDAPTGPEGPDRLPKKLTRAILNHCAEEHKWPKNSWAYDGRKSLYSPKDFLPKAKHVFPVKLPGGRGDKEFEVEDKDITMQCTCFSTSQKRAFKAFSVECDTDGSCESSIALKYVLRWLLGNI